MKLALLTREYPPDIYGGAGVHVGADPERDGKRFKVSRQGIVTIGKGQAIWPDE